MRLASLLLMTGTFVVQSTAANSQAVSNPVTGAGDAFGFRKGDEAIGIYDETSARGFNLEAAGNYRFHGTYFVKNSGVSSFFLESTSVRIGYSTLPIVLPSPSGVVDYALRDPARGEPSLVTVGLDPFVQPYAELLLKHRTGNDRLSAAAGVSFVPQVKDAQGGSSGGSVLLAGTARFRPGPFDLRLFGGEYRYQRPSQFRLVSEEAFLERQMDRNRFLGVPGLDDRGQRRIAGFLADASIGRHFGIGTTTVFTQEDPSRSFLTLYSGLSDDGTVDARIISAPAQRTTSVSSEIRGYWVGGQSTDNRHRIDALARFRRSRARFGGATVVALGRVPFEAPLDAEDQDFQPAGTAQMRDHISQHGWGISYRGVLGRWQVNAGLLQTRYQKRVAGPGLEPNELDASAWIYNFSVAHQLARKLEIYAGTSRGLEEAGVAPASASNRYEVLQPTAARQKEAGLIFRPRPDLKVMLGAFDLRRGYFGTDDQGIYGELGRVRHRGIELSAAGKAGSGLTLIVGGLFLDPEVRTSTVEDDRNFRPVGVPRTRLLLTSDFEVAPKVHLDATLRYVARRPASSVPGNDAQIAQAWTIDAGVRAPLRISGLKATARFQLLNMFNGYSWEVSSAGTMTYSPSRRFRLVLTSEL